MLENRFKLSVLALTITIAAALSGCAGSTYNHPNGYSNSAQSNVHVAETKTVTFAGKNWTCKQLVHPNASQCGHYVQKAFNAYAEKLSDLVTSDEVTELTKRGGATEKNAAYAGLIVCSVALAYRENVVLDDVAGPGSSLYDLSPEAPEVIIAGAYQLLCKDLNPNR